MSCKPVLGMSLGNVSQRARVCSVLLMIQKKYGKLWAYTMATNFAHLPEEWASLGGRFETPSLWALIFKYFKEKLFVTFALRLSVGSGQRYMICVTHFCTLLESKVCDSCMAVGFLTCATCKNVLQYLIPLALAWITPFLQASTCGQVLAPGQTLTAPKQWKLDVHVKS